MATYNELLELSHEELLRQRIMVACFVAAGTIWAEADTVPFHTERRAWAKRVFEMSLTELSRMQWVVLVANKDYTKDQILNATDAAIQSAVDNVVNLFAVT